MGKKLRSSFHPLSRFNSQIDRLGRAYAALKNVQYLKFKNYLG